ncbi:MAG TPA: hypothetical protein VMR18_00775 [Candidatus Saccharimonadales bacterium]|nr:hypothetical protein [Candidatus Saccharimonadales bacterium]
MPDLLSIKDIDKTEFFTLCEQAEAYRQSPAESVPIDTTQQGGLLFFESSTRTRLGFETAAWKLGVKTVSIYETKVNDTMSAAESIPDTIRTLNPYVSFFCIRHSDGDIFKDITPFTNRPVINCGNGSSEHPTQALIDGYTILQRFGRLDNLDITMVGALRYSRAAHSLMQLLSNFSDVNVLSLTEPELAFTDTEVEAFSHNGNSYQQSSTPDWRSGQIVYCAGFPPKTPGGEYSQEVRDRYKVTRSIADSLGDGIIMNPLPRIDEIDPEVDETPQAHYFDQNELGLYMRMAILTRYCLKS